MFTNQTSIPPDLLRAIEVIQIDAVSVLLLKFVIFLIYRGRVVLQWYELYFIEKTEIAYLDTVAAVVLFVSYLIPFWTLEPLNV